MEKKHFGLKLMTTFGRLLKVSVKENEVPTEKNSSRASIFTTKSQRQVIYQIKVAQNSFQHFPRRRL